MHLSFYLTRVIAALAIGIAVSYLTTPLSIKLAYKFDIIDKPRDDRRVHSRPIPRFGGLAIVLGSMAAMIIPAMAARACPSVTATSQLLMPNWTGAGQRRPDA